MKKRNLFIGMLFISALLVVASCAKSEDDTGESIEGTYYGTLTRTSTLKSIQSGNEELADGIAEVSRMGEGQIEVHCYGDEIDTTFMLDYYMHNDSAYVCLTGADFESMYGHMLGSGHMGGSMMGDIGDDETEWMHHMSDEHDDGDEHFGGFDMHNETFTYSIEMMDENGTYYLKFNGSKEQ
jgi:hypothetical protein